MNSISYLDSVLSRSFAPTTSDRPHLSRSSSSSSSSDKRSRSHSSLPGSRRPSHTSPPTPSGSSTLRRWSQDDREEPYPRSPYSNNSLRRTGSVPAGIHALDSDSDSSSSQTRSARWSGLWGLTGWLDEAIHPGSRSRSRKNSDSELASIRRTKRVPSLDDLLLSSTAPQRNRARRTASSGNGGSSTDDSQPEGRRRSRRQSRFGQSSLTLTSTSAGEEERHQDPELMTEKEREDIVEFDGGDFAPEDIQLRERTISQSSADSSSWDGESSLSHEAATLISPGEEEIVTQQLEQNKHTGLSQDQSDEKSVDSETLLEAAKGEPEAIEAVAKEDPTSTVVDPQAASAIPSAAPDAEDTPTRQRNGDLSASTSSLSTVTGSRRGSLRRKAHDSMSSSSSSLVSTDSEKAVDRSLTPSKPRKRRSTPKTSSEMEDSRSWLASRNGESGAPTPPKPKRKRSSSAKRAIRRTLVAIRDFLLSVLLAPIHCVRYLRRRRPLQPQADISQVPVLEKSPSLRFKSEPQPKRSSSALSSRPRTPKPDDKEAGFFEGPVTNEQAENLGQVWQALGGGQRTPSRLLPNPQAVDPMLAHNKAAEPIDEMMAQKEAEMEAERQSRIAKGRAARRAAAAKASASASDSEKHPSTPQSTAAVLAKVPRAPGSSIIHHSPKILVLDLDETLIHSTSRSPTLLISGRTTTSGFLGLETAGAALGLRANDNPRRIRPHMVEVVLDGRSVLYHVYKRPWADYFLRKVASWYTVVIFTASVQEYADPVIDWLDQGRGLISARLFRESCTYRGGSYVKELKVVDEDLSKVCLVDNSPASYAVNRANGIPVEGWTSDPNDEALLDLLPVLDSLRFASDVRHILGIRGW